MERHGDDVAVDDVGDFQFVQTVTSEVVEEFSYKNDGKYPKYDVLSRILTENC